MPSETTSHEKPRRHWTTTLGQAAAHPAAFAVVLLYALAGLAFAPKTFDFNAIATLIVWTMTLFIQRSTHRDTLAIHAKLDELIRAVVNARSELTRAPIPKFAWYRGNLRCELRNQRSSSNYCFQCGFEFEVPMTSSP
jgi:hypothetical protein